MAEKFISNKATWEALNTWKGQVTKFVAYNSSNEEVGSVDVSSGDFSIEPPDVQSFDGKLKLSSAKDITIGDNEDVIRYRLYGLMEEGEDTMAQVTFDEKEEYEFGGTFRINTFELELD